MEGRIVDYTRSIAGRVAERFKGDPAAELKVWLQMAEQRESMVVSVYSLGAVQRRLPASHTAEAAAVSEVAAKAIASIWAQETSHTRLLDSLRKVGGAHTTGVTEWQGSLEGTVTSLATASGISATVARWLVGLGRALGGAPEFTKGFDDLTFRQFCLFSAELEQTAAEGYERIAALCEALEQGEDALSAVQWGITFGYEIAKTLSEERFHASVLRSIVSWLGADDTFLPSPTARPRVVELRRLGETYLASSALRDGRGRGAVAYLGSPEFRTRSIGARWVSDGGLGELFSEYGIALDIVAPPAVAALDRVDS